jgi:hypothetical protein
MPKAGLFAGEVTQEAPANGAVTTKDKGYHWMEWGNTALPAPKQNRVIAWFDYEEGAGGGNTKLYSTNEPTWYFESQNGYSPTTGVVALGAITSVSGSQFHQFNPTFPGSDATTLVNQIWGHTFWFKTATVLAPEAGKFVSSHWVGGSPALGSGQRKFAVVYNSGANGFEYRIGNNFNPAIWITLDTGDIGLLPDTWYHVAITHDPDADEMSITVSERGGTIGTRFTETVTDGAYGATGGAMYIGGGGGVAIANGAFDMLAFWNTDEILSEQDVLELFTYELTYDMLET